MLVRPGLLPRSSLAKKTVTTVITCHRLILVFQYTVGTQVYASDTSYMHKIGTSPFTLHHHDIKDFSDSESLPEIIPALLLTDFGKPITCVGITFCLHKWLVFSLLPQQTICHHLFTLNSLSLAPILFGCDFEDESAPTLCGLQQVGLSDIVIHTKAPKLIVLGSLYVARTSLYMETLQLHF